MWTTKQWDPSKFYGTNFTPILSNGREVDSALFLFLENTTRYLQGLQLHAAHGIVSTQTKPVEIDSMTINELSDPTSEFWRDDLLKRYAHVVNRLVRSMNCKVFS